MRAESPSLQQDSALACGASNPDTQPAQSTRSLTFYFTIDGNSRHNIVKLDTSMSFAATLAPIQRKVQQKVRSRHVESFDLIVKLPSSGSRERDLDVEVDDDDSWEEITRFAMERELRAMYGLVFLRE